MTNFIHKEYLKTKPILIIFFAAAIMVFSCLKPPLDEPPVASFTCDTTSGEAPLTVIFNSSTSTGNITSYSWTFGDGGTSSSENETHTYNSEGTYTAELTVSGPGGSSSDTKTITVSVSAPVANFTFNPTSGYAPLTVIFNSSTSTGNITSYSWTFGDGGTSSSQNPSYTYSSAGTYTAKLTVTGPGGSNSKSETIPVSQPAPVANFTFNPTSGYAPLTVIFNSSTSTGNITSYSWTFGDGGTSSSQNPSYTYSSAGTYTAKLTVTGPGGSNSKSETIPVSGNPGTNITFYNKSFTEVEITLNSTTKTIAVGSSVTYSAIQGSSVYYSAFTFGKTDDGNLRIGSRMEWSGNLTLSGGTDSYNLNISDDYFFLYMRNSSSHTLKDLYVNYGLTSQTIDYILITNTGTTDPLGYYKALTNSNVRIYAQDNMNMYWQWNQGTNFTLPWTVNQYVSLAAISKKSANIAIDEKSSIALPGTSELPKQRYIYITDPNAKDLYSK